MNTPDDDRTAELLARALREEAALTEPQPDALQRIQERAGSASPPFSDSSDRARWLGAWSDRTNGASSRWGGLGGALGAGLATAAIITAVVVIGNAGTDTSAPPAGQPTLSEPSLAEPTASRPTGAEPTESAETGAEPTATEPTQPDPTATEPTQPDPTAPDPTAPDPTASDPTEEEPGSGQALHQGVYDPNAPADRQVTMYYAGRSAAFSEKGPRLYAEPHTLPAAPDDPALAAAREWWTSLPIDPDLMPVMMGSPDLEVVDVSQSEQSTTIAIEGPEGPTAGDQSLLSGDHLVGSPAQQHALILSYYQALLRTAGVEDEARFTYNGEPVDESNGVRLDPLRVMPDEEVRAWIDIVTPVEGQTVSNPVTVTVSGNVFEGNVNWQLFDQAGAKVDEGFVTTAFTVWRQADIELGTLEPGTYRIRCLEYSMEDGSPMNIVDKTFTVE
ncbi:MAG: hypothetical protein H0T14_05530 [Nocardioidaceae bacterium]|nr:hypothetical protein [Nocardioidaceae bacterium]